ncbi:acyl-coenzyme A diphosphatase NUDT19 isoform X2 [Choristoneura fumiferana]|uniref:acyl-coenzyme A diphosphatase NUDT19 isoform X2 n=1 Tax=Choristoneura fumiferana TaxID=7141 RepID=UPI003D15DDAB
MRPCNLPTRTASASFANSVVFPGGVSEPVDASEDWLRLFKAFGFDQSHFEAFHRPGAPATPIFQDNPVKRHISLRITAIRETFEELGLLLCCKQHQKDRSSPWACVLPIADVKQWQQQISKNPSELLNLCKEYQCYPDIWALHYWSNWLTPTHFPKRFDAAFFITALEDKPECLDFNAEVAHVQWASPVSTLERCRARSLVLFPPQSYELSRLSVAADCEALLRFAAARSARGHALHYPVIVHANDGQLHLLPGDDLYPSDVDYNNGAIKADETVLELRERSKVLHRYESFGSVKQFIIKNFKSDHIDMGDRIIPVIA